MLDIEYVKSVLTEDYPTSYPHENNYPDLNNVIDGNDFDYAAGIVFGETPNGNKCPEGHSYLWFKEEGKSILSHRFIVAVTLGKWPPREFDVDHINHNRSDNRPVNLRVVTRRDNNGNRRPAAVRLSDLADIDDVAATLEERKSKKTQRLEKPRFSAEKALSDLQGSSSMETFFTGETKPAEYSNGTWHKTCFGSWHLIFV